MQSILIVCFISLALLNGCNEAKTVDNNEDAVASVELERLSFSIKYPQKVEKGSEFSVQGEISNISESPMEISHGRPPITFSIANQRIFPQEDIQLTTNLNPGESLHYEATFTINKKGTYNLIARTSLLETNGQMINGKGDEDYLEEDMKKTIRQLEKSKLSINSMKIEVVE